MIDKFLDASDVDEEVAVMLLQILDIKNYRLLESVQIEFKDPITVFIGPNNVGKSNLIDGLLFIRDALAGNLNVAITQRHGFERIASGQNQSATIGFELAIQTAEHPTTLYSVIFDRSGMIHERVNGTGDISYEANLSGNRIHVHGSAFNRESARFFLVRVPAIEPIIQFLNDMVHVDPFRNVSTQTPIAAKRMIQSTGFDLAQVLHYHYNNDREEFNAYEAAASKVLSGVGYY